MTAFLAKDARRAIINRCATHLSARFAGRAFAVPAFTNDVSPAASTLSLLGQRGEGVASGPCTGATPELFNAFHDQPNSTGAHHDHVAL